MVQDKVREALEEALETQVAQHVKGALNQSWAPEEPLSEQLSPWMEQLIGALEVRFIPGTARLTLLCPRPLQKPPAYFERSGSARATDVHFVAVRAVGMRAQEAFALGESCMPPDKLVAMKRRAFALVDEHLAALFSGAALRAWNPHGMRRFAGDVDAMLQLAGRHGCEKSLLRVDDLCSFLVREQWHLAGNTEHLTSSYPNMDPPLVRHLHRTDVCLCHPLRLPYLVWAADRMEIARRSVNGGLVCSSWRRCTSTSPARSSTWTACGSST